MILSNQGSLFNIPTDVTYLNCAYLSPSLRGVMHEGIEGMNLRAQPWRLTATDWFDRAEEMRVLFARIIRASPEQIALVPSVSYGIAIAAKNVPLEAGQRIIVLDQQYPSNVYAWHERSRESGAELVTIKRQPSQTWTEAIMEAMDERTGLVAVPNCHWADGSTVDLELVGKEARKVNAALVVDASQSAGAYPLDVGKIQPDFLVTVAYKWLMGPYGLGYMYADKPYCESGSPIEYTWLNRKGSDDFSSLVSYQDDFRPGARRFDFGEFPGFINLPMGLEGLRQVLAWGVENIAETLEALTGKIENMAMERGYSIRSKQHRLGHMIGVQLSESQSQGLQKKLGENNVYVSFRGSSMRVSPHLYNNAEDIERLFEFM